MQERKTATTYAIAGRHSNLSAAEWIGRYGRIVTEMTPPVIFLSRTFSDWQEAINAVGGTVKLGTLIEWWPSAKPDDIAPAIAKHLLREHEGASKLRYGISVYGLPLRASTLGGAIKATLTAAHVRSRYVTSREPQLSSVVIGENNLLTAGGEYCLFPSNGGIALGVTRAIQDYVSYGRRDYGRPARDARVGMLPPKLAQMMINLGWLGTEATLLDPFCGSGTIIQEAAQMGIGRVLGSDIDPKGVERTRKNIAALPVHDMVELSVLDAQHLAEHMPRASVDAIITEPDLGPPIRTVSLSRVTDIKRSLETLYSEAVLEFRTVLKHHGALVMVWPFWSEGKQTIHMDPWTILKARGFEPISFSVEPDTLNGPPRHSFLYRRPRQIVGREIIVARRVE